MRIAVVRSPHGVGLAWGRWGIAVALGLPVWWLPRWGRSVGDLVEEWHVGWLLVCVGLLRLRTGRAWPLLEQAGRGGQHRAGASAARADRR